MDLLALSPKQFIAYLNTQGIQTFHFVTQNDRLVASHPSLAPIAEILTRDMDYDSHEGIFCQISSNGILQSAAVHRTHRGPAAGGVRNWIYDNMLAFFQDGMRLSRGMTHKNALAGIWWGGGKGVMAKNSVDIARMSEPEFRRQVYEEYGSFMTALHGCYVTAEDVGTCVDDMDAIFSRTRHTTCISPKFGGSGNPSIPTAKGVLRGLQAAFDFVGKSLMGSTIAVQGCGHVGMPLIQYLFESGVKKVIASDVDEHRALEIRNQFIGHDFTLSIVEKSDCSILFSNVDAVCPCATGGILNKDTIPKIKAKIVCGAANNQLRDIQTDNLLIHNHDILYVPDFLVNRMGIVNCADEHMGVIEDDPKMDLHLGQDWENSIFNLTTAVLKESMATGKTTQEIAINIAEKRSFELNPCYGHRSLQVINWLVQSQEWKTRLAKS
jgi:glutamate dehydrogenase/leucine dehydrogenase